MPALLILTACNRAGENKEAVRQAVLQHLQKNAALDVNQLSVDISSVKFQGSQATAAVSIRPKSSPDQGMSMTYTLQKQGNQWQVSGRGSGHGDAGTGMGTMPSPQGQSGALPPGHPPVNAPPNSR